ncbi:hypothetical protein Q8F55_008276 [Vanrija albida]|uniref:Major facilitator superfamily (MFS) profile domain-containing protein n=1 Tax=Vanrija albida TaxID=181172 RepID=A0ABR3PVW0_9TREE
MQASRAGMVEGMIDGFHHDHSGQAGTPNEADKAITSDKGVTPDEADHQLVAPPVDDRPEKLPFGYSVSTPPASALTHQWRSSSWYITLVVTVGTFSDILSYAIIIPVIPYHLQDLGHENVSALTSWLLFAYSAGIFISTFPVAYFFHRYPVRRMPLVVAVLIMEGSFVLFMVAKPYWCMVLSRVIQGACSAVVWTVGFALICENIDPKNLGTNLGIAFSGVAVGVTVAPPIGGALYQHLGWHAPFIFCIILLGLDLVGRILVVEPKKKRFGALAERDARWEAQKQHAREAIHRTVSRAHSVPPSSPTALAVPLPQTTTASTAVASSVEPDTASTVHDKPKELSAIGVLIALAKMPRGLTAFMLVFTFGLVIGTLDPTLTLRVQAVWHKNADFVGIVYLAAAAPALFVGALAGWMADMWGSEWVLIPSLFLILPWAPLLILKSSLAGFMAYFAMMNLFATVLNTIAGLEMAIVAKQKEGISEIHEFAAMNLAFSVSSAVGAIVGGQIYDHVKNGWAVICWVSFGVFVATLVPPLFYAGNWTVWDRLRGVNKPPPSQHGHAPDEERAEGAGSPEADGAADASTSPKALTEAASTPK